VFIVSVIVKSNSHAVVFFTSYVHFVRLAVGLLRDNPLKPATPLTNGAIDETLQ